MELDVIKKLILRDLLIAKKKKNHSCIFFKWPRCRPTKSCESWTEYPS